MELSGGLLQVIVAIITVFTAIWFYMRQRKNLYQSVYLKPPKLNLKQSSGILAKTKCMRSMSSNKCMRSMSTNSYTFEEPKYKKDPDVDEGELIGIDPREEM